MRKYFVLLGALVVCSGLIWVVSKTNAENSPNAATEKKQKEMKVTGEVVDLWCYLDSGARGAKHKECAMACVKEEQPIGIVDEKGHVYLLLGAKDNRQGIRGALAEHMAETAIVTGKFVRKEGIEAVFIDSFSIEGPGDVTLYPVYADSNNP